MQHENQNQFFYKRKPASPSCEYQDKLEFLGSDLAKNVRLFMSPLLRHLVFSLVKKFCSIKLSAEFSGLGTGKTLMPSWKQRQAIRPHTTSPGIFGVRGTAHGLRGKKEPLVIQAERGTKYSQIISHSYEVDLSLA